MAEGAQQFNGIDTAVRITNGSIADWSETDGFTIEYWIRRLAGTLSDTEIVVGRIDPDTQIEWYSGISSSGTGIFFLSNANGEGAAPDDMLSGTSALNDGEWHHVAVVRDNETGQNMLYIDGVFESAKTVDYTSGFQGLNSEISIGRLSFADGFYFEGDIDEVAIYTRALTDFEITQHYYDGKIGLRFGYCPDATPVRVMPMGDSITYDSYGGDPRLPGMKTGYRQPLWLSLSNAGYSVDFVGNKIAGQDAIPLFDPDNAGFPGIKSYQLAELLADGFNAHTGEEETPGPYFDYFPTDVVLLHIGTNDLLITMDGVEATLDAIDAYDPGVPVIIARIVNQVPYNPSTTEFNDLLESMVDARITSGDRLILADMEDDAGIVYEVGIDMVDAYHPSKPGYEKMAKVWTEELKLILPMPEWTPPEILSEPVTEGYFGIPYSYQIAAAGFPFGDYQLKEGPAGLNVNLETGLITWLPDSTGIFEVSVEVTNPLGVGTQIYFITVENTFNLDDGDAGTTPFGSWIPSNGDLFYGTQSLFSKVAGSTYTYATPYVGTAEVSLWWTVRDSRCDSVEVQVWDGETLLDDTIRVNQLLDGGQWNPVGTYSFTGMAKVVIVASGTCSTCADAVQFTSTESPELDTIQIEGPASVTEGATSTYTVTAYYLDAGGSSRSVDADGWSVDCPFYAEITDQGVLTAYEVTVDQACLVSASYTENSNTRTADFPITILNHVQPLQVILDDGDAGTTPFGSWIPSNGDLFYGTQSLFSKVAGSTYTCLVPRYFSSAIP